MRKHGSDTSKEAKEARQVVALLKGALASFEAVAGDHKEAPGISYAIDLIERAYMLKAQEPHGRN